MLFTRHVNKSKMFQKMIRPSASTFGYAYTFMETFMATVVVTVVVMATTFVDGQDTERVTYITDPEVSSDPCSHVGSFLCLPEIDRTDVRQECVPAEAECNGFIDCSNQWDERVQKCGCPQDEFQCNATTCIDMHLRCDGTDHCYGGKDEMDCETYICPPTHIKCDSHVCLSRDKECDFVDDCGDWSDEKNCPRRNCYITEFQCRNGQCTAIGRLCDGVQDCVDGSDEDQWECDKYTKCKGGVYMKNTSCDGWSDCHYSNSDELNCGQCGDHQYTCPNGQCISQSNVCDSHCDCLTCEEENDCESYTCTKEEKFLCQVQGKCIDKARVCDGVNDCKNSAVGWDEFNCSSQNACPGNGTTHILCREGRCLPAELLCNGMADCRDGEDEAFCPDQPPCGEDHFRCSSGQCVDKKRRCDAKFDCIDRSDEGNCESFSCGPSMFRCKAGHCVHEQKRCDWIRHCRDGSDEIGCARPNCTSDQFRCDSGQCIDTAYVCYGGKTNSSLGCADNSHLFHCTSHACGAGQYRCQEGYCIDVDQICDGEPDCKFTNSDEKCMYMCPIMADHQKRCICKDEKMNCDHRNLTDVPPLHESEHFTSMRLSGNSIKISDKTFSSSHFSKLTYLDLSNNSLHAIPNLAFVMMWRLTFLSLSDNTIDQLDSRTFEGLTNLKILHLSGNRISSIQPGAFLPLVSLSTLDLSNQRLSYLETDVFRGLKRVLHLNLANNRIETLSNNAFNGLHTLLKLNLSRNGLRSLEHGVFFGLQSLQTLDLSSNRLVQIPNRLFNGLVQMRFLDLSDNRIRHLGDGVFLPMTRLETLLTDHYKFCCLAGPYVQCQPQADEFSSCEDLMSNHVLRISIWVLGVLALLGNLVVILWRLRDFRGGRVHSFLITNLAIGDLLMGVYLLIIAGVDLQYRGSYIIHDEEWRRSDLCRFAGFVSTFSSELSVLTLTTITLDRLLCILFPLKRTRLGLKQAIIVMALIWAFVFLIAITPLFGFHYFQDFYGRSGVCLALHITPDRPAGWEYSVAIFLVLNFTSFLVIAASYFWMFIVARKTRKAVRTSESPNDTAMARRMTIIVMTDFCCWVPIILLGFVSLAGARTDNQVYAWIAVFVLPLNSATNPILYTLSTAPFLGNVRKRVTVFRKSFINSIQTDTKHSYVEDRTTHYYYDRKSPYRQLELIRLRSLNNSTSVGCYSRDNFIDT